MHQKAFLASSLFLRLGRTLHASLLGCFTATPNPTVPPALRRNHITVMRAATLSGLLALSGPVLAAPGDLDTTFGTNGTAAATVTTASGTRYLYADSLVLQPDTKILILGDVSDPSISFALARYNTDGSRDTTFGSGGMTLIGTNIKYFGFGNPIAVQPDGKVIVAGNVCSGNCALALVRYNADGSLDTSFGANGSAITTTGQSFNTNAVVLQPNGRIIVAGDSTNGTDVSHTLIRFDADGGLDTSFGANGSVTTLIEGAAKTSALALLPNGRIIIAGNGWNGTVGGFSLARYNADGSLDASFGSQGAVNTDIDPVFFAAHSLALQSDGKILAAGSSNSGKFVLSRYNTNGSLDTTFGNSGILTTNLGNSYSLILVRTLVLQPDGKIVVTAASYDQTPCPGQPTGTICNANPDNNFLALLRYNTDGSLDPTFGTSGMLTLDKGRSFGSAVPLALRPDGKLVVTEYDGSGFPVLARREGDSFDLTPDPFSFTSETGVKSRAVVTSNIITISGLSDGVSVPVQVKGGEYSLNGTPYTRNPGYAKNGDQIAVRHTASTFTGILGNTTRTTLTVGGLQSPQQPGAARHDSLGHLHQLNQQWRNRCAVAVDPVVAGSAARCPLTAQGVAAY